MYFEKAVMNAFSGQFPNKIRLKSVYETNDEVRTYVHCLPVLAFVPPDDVEQAFDILRETQPTADHMDELTSFFEHTYIRGRRRCGRAAVFHILAHNISSVNCKEAIYLCSCVNGTEAIFVLLN